jgi:hypothetical protein
MTFYWQLDTYRTRAAADEAKGPRGTVVESCPSTLSSAGFGVAMPSWLNATRD